MRYDAREGEVGAVESTLRVTDYRRLLRYSPRMPQRNPISIPRKMHRAVKLSRLLGHQLQRACRDSWQQSSPPLIRGTIEERPSGT